MWYERCWRCVREHLTITVPGAVLIFAATYVLMLAVNAGEIGAAWAGAIGSIGAVIAAFMVANSQARAAAQSARERTSIYRSLVADLADRAHREAIQLEQITTSSLNKPAHDAEQFAKEGLEAIFLELKEINVVDIGDEHMARSVLQLRAELYAGLKLYRVYIGRAAGTNRTMLRYDILQHAVKAQELAKGLMPPGSA